MNSTRVCSGEREPFPEKISPVNPQIRKVTIKLKMGNLTKDRVRLGHLEFRPLDVGAGRLGLGGAAAVPLDLGGGCSEAGCNSLDNHCAETPRKSRENL